MTRDPRPDILNLALCYFPTGGGAGVWNASSFWYCVSTEANCDFPNATRLFVNKRWVSKLYCALAVSLSLSIHFSAFGGEDTEPPLTPSDKKPEPEATPTAPRPAAFSDYVPPSPIASPLNRNLFPIVENSASPVANQLVQAVSNEAIFQTGAAPRPPTLFYRAAERGDATPQLRSGPFLFHTGITIENVFSDNFFGTVRGERASWLRNYTPIFSLTYEPNKNMVVDTSYSFTMHDYSTTVTRDYYDENASIGIKLAHFGIDGLTFNIGNVYNQTGNTIINPLADRFDISNLEFVTGTRFSTDSLPILFTYNAGPVTLEAGYTYYATDYFSDEHAINDAQQHLVSLRGSYDVLPTYLNFFGEYSFNHTLYPSFKQNNFNFQRVFTGIKGKLDNFTYQIKTGYAIFDPLETGDVVAHPLLSGDFGYAYSPRFDFSLFGNRTFDSGVLTNARVTDSYGGYVNLRPMLRGVLSLSHVWQSQSGRNTEDSIESSALTYKHKILNLIEPRIGVKYTVEDFVGSTQDITWTGSAAMGFSISPRTAASIDFYHEDTQRSDKSKRITDRLTAGYTYKINFFSSVSLGYDHALRRNTDAGGNVQINELRINVNLAW